MRSIVIGMNWGWVVSLVIIAIHPIASTTEIFILRDTPIKFNPSHFPFFLSLSLPPTLRPFCHYVAHVIATVSVCPPDLGRI